MKVLMAAPFNPQGRYAGGICTIVNGIIKETSYLDKLGLHIVPFETCRVSRQNVERARLNFGNVKNTLKMWTAISKEINANSAEVLYFHTSRRFALLKDLITVAIAKHKTSIQTILHIHFAGIKNILTDYKWADRLMMHLMNKYVDEMVFLSKQTKQEFMEYGLETKTRVIYNYGQLTKCDIDNKVQSNKEQFEMLFVGSIDERKGILDLLEAMTRLPLPIRLRVCGGGASVKIQDAFSQYQSRLGNRLVFHGYVSGEEKQRIFNNADALVLPSYGEGLPLVIFEAYQAGCAVITTEVGAIREVVKEDNGFFIVPGDIDGIVQATERLINDRELLKQMQLANWIAADQYTIYVFIDGVYKASTEVVS